LVEFFKEKTARFFFFFLCFYSFFTPIKVDDDHPWRGPLCSASRAPRTNERTKVHVNKKGPKKTTATTMKNPQKNNNNNNNQQHK
jgi:hypothetical protein